MILKSILRLKSWSQKESSQHTGREMPGTLQKQVYNDIPLAVDRFRKYLSANANYNMAQCTSAVSYLCICIYVFVPTAIFCPPIRLSANTRPLEHKTLERSLLFQLCLALTSVVMWTGSKNCYCNNSWSFRRDSIVTSLPWCLDMVTSLTCRQVRGRRTLDSDKLWGYLRMMQNDALWFVHYK